MAAQVVSSVTTNCTLTFIEWLPTGDYVLNYLMADSTTGAVRRTHRWIVKGDGTGLFDESGVFVQAVPGSFITNLATIKTNVDTALTNAAGAGKITL